MLSMTQRKPSHRRGKASYTSFTVSASEERLSATASSRVAAAERRGRSSPGGSSSLRAGISQPAGSRAQSPAPAPALSRKLNAPASGWTQSTPATQPPA